MLAYILSNIAQSVHCNEAFLLLKYRHVFTQSPLFLELGCYVVADDQSYVKRR